MNLSDFRRHKFTTFFKHLDLDDDDAITGADFGRYADRIRAEKGWVEDSAELARLRATTDAWWRLMREHADDDGDDRIDLPEFLAFFEHVGQQTLQNGSPPEWAVELCVHTHALLDLDADGAVDAHDFSLWLRSVGASVDPADAFRRIDMNGDGVVTLPELLVLFGQFVLSENAEDPGNYVMTGAL